MEENTKTGSQLKTISIDLNKLLTTVLAILVVVLVVQAFQLVGMSATVSEQGQKLASLEASGASLSASAAGSASTGGSGALPPSLQNLPDMVGGC